MKKVLVVAYDYPPRHIVGAIRPSKFVHYLPGFGWEPIVLAGRDEHPDIPGNSTAEIYHVREWPHPLKTYYRFLERRAKKKGRIGEFVTQMCPPYAVAMSRRKLGIAQVKQWIVDFMRVPDEELGWLIPATVKGISLIRKKKITHLITTAPPFTTQLVGLALKRLTGVHWVADFRDPWSVTVKYNSPGNRITDAVESRLIRSVMKSADVVLSVTPPMTEQLKKEHPDLDPDKFVTLTNGFDPRDFADLNKSRATSGPVLFSYIGEFAYGRTPEPFLQALRSLLDSGELKRGDVQVKFIGVVEFAEGRSVSQMVQNLGLEGIVTIEPLIPRREALQRAMESHVLLVLTEQHPFVLTFKLFDALAAGAIILNIGSKGAVADVLAKTKRGVAANHTSLAEIQNGILECVRRSRAEETQRTLEPWADTKIQDYNFQKLTGRLAEILEGAGPIKMPGSEEQRVR